jgi:hypothetical protein
MSDVQVTMSHRRRAEESLGGSARELAEKVVVCEDHDPGYYERGQHVGRACQSCGKVLSDNWIPHDELPEDYETFNLDRVERQQEREYERQREFYSGLIDSKAEEIAQDEIYQEARELTPPEDASAADWKQAFERVSTRDAKSIIRESYYKSDAWASRRQAKRNSADDGLSCEAQLPGCTGDDDHIHHKSYEHLGCEPLWDLAAVCHHCHDIIHGHKEPTTVHEERMEAEVAYEDLYGEPALNGEDSSDLSF